MMKTEHWTLLAFVIFIALFVVFRWHIYLTSVQVDNDRQAENVLKESCLAALSTASSDEYIFSEEEQRTEAIDKFIDVFNAGYDYVGYRKNDIDFKVPFIILVDTDGYYIRYTKLVDNGSGVRELKPVLTGINTWTNTYNSTYTVRFYLDDIVEVTDLHTGAVTRGLYREVYSSLGSPTHLAFMQSEHDFHEEKVYQICTQTEDVVNYYITTHNEHYNRDERKYIFTMPQINDIDKRLMNKPSVISFVQSSQAASDKGYINSYALAGSIKDKTKLYYEGIVNGQLYYHEADCSDLGHTPSNSQGKTMEECATNGATPCPKCVLRGE